jgi:Tetracyclin repressor-like, C-terminal domain
MLESDGVEHAALTARQREEHKDSAREYAKLWHRLITRAQSRGELRKEVDAGLFRLFLFGSVTASSRSL